MIETLPLLTPDPERGERTLARCHQRLARRRQKLEADGNRADSRYLAVERVVVCGLCVVYISAVAFAAIQILAGR